MPPGSAANERISWRWPLRITRSMRLKFFQGLRRQQTCWNCRRSSLPDRGFAAALKHCCHHVGSKKSERFGRGSEVAPALTSSAIIWFARWVPLTATKWIRTAKSSMAPRRAREHPRPLKEHLMQLLALGPFDISSKLWANDARQSIYFIVEYVSWPWQVWIKLQNLQRLPSKFEVTCS